MPPFGSVCRHKWLQVHRRTSVAAWILRRGLRYSYFVCSELYSCASNRAVTKGTCYCQMWTFSWSHMGDDRMQRPHVKRVNNNEMMAPRQEHRRYVRQVHDEQASLVSLMIWEISSMVAKPLSVKM